MDRKPVLLTEASMAAARQHFADLCDACIEAATESRTPRSDQFRVNDLAAYRESELKAKRNFLAGKQDHTFTLRQWAHYVQTGEMVPLFGK